MRFPRNEAEGLSFYHCVSRVVDRRFILQTAGHGSAEAERFVQVTLRARKLDMRLTALGCADALWVFPDLRVRPIG